MQKIKVLFNKYNSFSEDKKKIINPTNTPFARMVVK